MRLLLVYYEPASSGQTTHVLSLARGLDLRRYELVVVLPQTLARAIAEFQRMGARVVPLPLRRIAWSPATVAELARLIREWRPDAVHVHSQEAGLVARPVARLSGARSILYTPQTIDIRRSRWQVFYQYLERALGGITDTIVSVNEADRQRLVRWGIPSAKVVTIPNGIVLADFAGTVDASQLRRSLGLDPARPLVLQVGRLSAQKDPLAFVEGAALVAEDRPDVQFALAGDGPLKDRVAARIRELRLERCVSLLGWHERASELMAASNVVALTSRWEGAPYALLEAMARSRPVVATAVNGCPEIVAEGETGLLVPPGQPVAWAQAVARLLDDSEAAAVMGRRGRQRVEECFALSRMIGRIEALYERVGC